MVKNKKGKTASGGRGRTVFVGMSGGVDSSVSAAILKKQGYNVVGVFIRTWHPEFLTCTEEIERLDAMRVAAHLDIPFLTFDFEEVYKREVADYMIAEYRAGRTPNPDVVCNREIKFGAFLKKALSMGADYVATGHYARNIIKKENSKDFPAFALGVKRTGNPRLLKSFNFPFLLVKAVDPAKDQTYFLWTLKQEQLGRILFPVGHLNKTEVRKLAQKFKLPVAEKKDSQGICFLGAVDLKEFLKHYIKEKKGEVVLVPSDEGGEKKEIIGYHSGAVFYTLGERHGFTITKKNPNDGAYYVVGKDVKENILYVSRNSGARNFLETAPSETKGQGTHTFLKNSSRRNFKIKDVNWISGIPPAFNFQLSTFNLLCQIRYHGEFLPCQVKIKNKTETEIIFSHPTMVAPGQSVVIYSKDVCLGGGIVT